MSANTLKVKPLFKRNRESLGDRIFDIGVYTIAFICVLIVLYPLYLVVINSLSDPYAVAAGKVTFFPVGFSLDSYIAAFENGDIITGYVNSLFYTIVGTLFSMMLTIPAAYALSKPRLVGRSTIMMMIVFTSPDLKKENGKPVVLMYRPDILNVIWASATQKFKD